MSVREEIVQAFRRGDTDRTRELAEELQRSGEEVFGLCWLGRVGLREGDFARANDLATQARALAGDDDESRMPLHIQAAATRMAGDTDPARELYLESIELNRRLENPFLAAELYNLGFLEVGAGNIERARELFDEALVEARARDVDDLPRFVVLGHGAVAIETGDVERGVTLLAVGLAAVEAEGEVLDPDDQAAVDRELAKARGALEPRAYERAFEEGRKLSVDEALG
jgi:tetratricopeptide (TPR) repeat protein